MRQILRNGDITHQNSKDNRKITVAAMGDLHIRDISSGTYTELFQKICKSSDVLLLAGDLTDRGLISEAEVLAQELSGCTIPIIAVLGNHDMEAGQEQEISSVLIRNHIIVLDGDFYEFNGVGIAGIKGFGGGFGNHMLQAWGEKTIKQFVHETVDDALRLESALAKLNTRKKIVLLHYSPVRDTVVGESPEIFPFVGSSRLAEAIDRFDVTAVFHGHSHSGTARGQTGNGAPVYNVSLPLMQRISPKQPYVLIDI